MWEFTGYCEARKLCSACVMAELPVTAPWVWAESDDMAVRQLMQVHGIGYVSEVHTGVCEECGTEKF